MIPSPITIASLTRTFSAIDIDYDAILERAYQVYALVSTVLIWATALTFTAGGYARRLFEYARPGLAKALHQLALALDGALAYPDQPEPAPVVVPTPSRKTRRSR